MIKGPGIALCQPCSRKAHTRLLDSPSLGTGDYRAAEPGFDGPNARPAPRQCAFCGRTRRACAGLVAYRFGAICGNCLALSAEVFAEHTAG